jgi:hypothetical protein
MNLFFKRDRMKEYNLWHDWHVTLSGKYEHVNNGDSGQLINEDASRVIYGSVFVLEGVENVKDEIDYIGIKQDESGSYSLSASVAQNNEFLSITVTYLNAIDEEWASSVIESARRL